MNRTRDLLVLLQIQRKNKCMELINDALKMRMFAFVVLRSHGDRRTGGGGGGTTMPHAYTRIRTRAAAMARECLNTAISRPLIVSNVNVQRTTFASHTTLQVYSGAQDFAMFSYSILFV